MFLRLDISRVLALLLELCLLGFFLGQRSRHIVFDADGLIFLVFWRRPKCFQASLSDLFWKYVKEVLSVCI